MKKNEIAFVIGYLSMKLPKTAKEMRGVAGPVLTDGVQPGRETIRRLRLLCDECERELDAFEGRKRKKSA